MLAEFWEGLFNWRYWVTLAWTDIRGRYRRTFLGPFWTTINSVFFVSLIGLVYSFLWGIPIVDFLPFVAAGYFIWVYLSGTLMESCGTFTAYGEIIKTVPISPMSLLMRVITRNVFVLAHNLVVFIPIALLFGVSLKFFPLAFVGLFFVSLALVGSAMCWAFLCARFRDFEQVMLSIVTLMFLVTPILWNDDILPGRVSFVADWNPFFHLIEVIRAPMLGGLPSMLSVIVTGGLVVGMLGLGMLVYAFNRHKLAYWL